MKCCPVVAARIVRSESRDGKFVTPTTDRLNRKAFCVGDFVAAAGFEPAFSRGMNPADYHFPTPLCACRDTAISAGSHFVGASGEVFLVS